MIAAFTLLISLLAIAHGSPVARDNDGARPISWIAPDGSVRCWEVQNGQFINGQTLGVAACNGSPFQQFIYNEGATTIQVAGNDLTSTDYCVEFGPGLGVNGRPLRIQRCRANGAPGQRLFVTDDNHVALRNGPGQCADVTDGGSQAVLQSWRCAADNGNQIFVFGQAPGPGPDPGPDPPGPEPEPVYSGLMRWQGGDGNLCLQATSLDFVEGDYETTFPLELGLCETGDPDLQRFAVDFTLYMANTTCCDEPLEVAVRLTRQGGPPFASLGRTQVQSYPVFAWPNPDESGVYTLATQNWAKHLRCVVVVPDSGAAVGYSPQVQYCEPGSYSVDRSFAHPDNPDIFGDDEVVEEVVQEVVEEVE